jgi:hypothetical protein
MNTRPPTRALPVLPLLALIGISATTLLVSLLYTPRFAAGQNDDLPALVPDAPGSITGRVVDDQGAPLA